MVLSDEVVKILKKEAKAFIGGKKHGSSFRSRSDVKTLKEAINKSGDAVTDKMDVENGIIFVTPKFKSFGVHIEKSGTIYSSNVSESDMCKIVEKSLLENIALHPLISERDKKYFVAIPFDLKDDLKKTIPSAKFDSKTKSWYVGSRSWKKLSVWVLQHENEIKDGQKAKAEFQKEVESRVAINGHTFSFKEMLKEEGAIFADGKWRVDASKAKAVQKKIDALNESRKQTFININSEKLTNLADVKSTLEAMIRATKNSDMAEHYANKEDDFYNDLIKYSHFGELKQSLVELLDDVEKAMLFVDDDSHFSLNAPSEILRFFGLPNEMKLDEQFNIIAYSHREFLFETVVDPMIKAAPMVENMFHYDAYKNDLESHEVYFEDSEGMLFNISGYCDSNRVRISNRKDRISVSCPDLEKVVLTYQWFGAKRQTHTSEKNRILKQEK